jgi:hypothetical protein
MGLLLPQHRDGMPQGWQYKLGRICEIAERKADAVRKHRK